MQMIARRIHDNEDGMQSLQVVMIVAISALILAALKLAWPSILLWFNTWVYEIMI